MESGFQAVAIETEERICILPLCAASVPASIHLDKPVASRHRRSVRC